jgi:pimeloyl-ACP methyl ester carboxylesterase
MIGGYCSGRRGWCWWTTVGLATVAVLVGCGSSQSASTTAAGTFPRTPAGAQAGWLVQALNHVPISDAALRAHVSPVVLGKTDAAALNSGLAGVGQVRLVSVTRSQARSIAFVISVRGAQHFRTALTVDADGLIAGVAPMQAIPSTASPQSMIPRLAPGWTAQPVSFPAGGVTIYGTYTHPSNAPARTIPAAVLLAGSGTATNRNDNGTATDRNGKTVWQPYRNTLEAVANWLSADGVASVRYDKLGSGQTGWGSYAGHPERVGLESYEQEAVAALSFLARQAQVNPSRLAVVGHSEGGLYALLLATGVAAHAPNVHAVVLLEPVTGRMLSFFVPAPGTAPPRVRQSLERAVTSLRRTGRLPGGLPAEVTNGFNPTGWGTQLELSQIDRYDPATLAAKLPPGTAVLLTCSNADQYFTCSMEDGIATGVSKANARIDFVHLDGVDHLLKEDITRDPAAWNQALPFSTQLQAALRTFAAENL